MGIFDTLRRKKVNKELRRAATAPPGTDRSETEARPDEATYRSKCLESAYEEEEEVRSWNSDSAFRRILDPLNRGDNATACREAETLVPRFSDFADIYYWWGKGLLGMDSHDRARHVLLDGLGKAKQKYSLCTVLGEVEWKMGNLGQAVYWWTQALHCQESLNNYGGEVGAYLYLHYVADGLGLRDCAAALLMRVDQIRPGNIRLSSESATKVVNLARTNAQPGMAEVLRDLVERYVVPKDRRASKADPEEVERWIRQLEKRDELGWSSEENVRAAEKLGELGDPRAIEPLTRAMRDLSLSLQVAAERAIEKIRMANKR